MPSVHAAMVADHANGRTLDDLDAERAQPEHLLDGQRTRSWSTTERASVSWRNSPARQPRHVR